jgi:hypothetical protein
MKDITMKRFEETQADAIDVLVRKIPRLRDSIWITRASEINNELTGLSGGEKIVYDAAISIWNGEKTVDLYRFLVTCSKEIVNDFIEALRIINAGDGNSHIR